MHDAPAPYAPAAPTSYALAPSTPGPYAPVPSIPRPDAPAPYAPAAATSYALAPSSPGPYAPVPSVPAPSAAAPYAPAEPTASMPEPYYAPALWDPCSTHLDLRSTHHRYLLIPIRLPHSGHPLPIRDQRLYIVAALALCRKAVGMVRVQLLDGPPCSIPQYAYFK